MTRRRRRQVAWLCGLLVATVLTPAAAQPSRTKTPATHPSTTTTSTTAKTPRAGSVTTSKSATAPETRRQATITAELSTLRAQVAEASAEEAAVLDSLDAVADRRRSIEIQLGDLDAELTRLEDELAAATERMGGIGVDLQRVEAKLSATEDGLDGARSDLADRAVRAYIHQPAAQLATVLLERQSFRELAATRDFLSAMVEAQALSLGRYQTLRHALSAERQDLMAVRNVVAQHHEQVVFHRQQLIELRSRRLALRSSAAVEETRQKNLLTDVRSRVREFEAEIAALKKESDSLGALLRGHQKAQKKPPGGSGALTAPVAGAITSEFGNRRHPIFGTMRVHNGVDFTATSGTPVRAAADGVVVVAGGRGGYGTTVVIDHGNTIATLYAHLSRAAVGEGARIARGAVVAYAGSSGYSTGPHLHFEVRANGRPVDPRRYL